MRRPAAAEHRDTVPAGAWWRLVGALLLATLAGAHLVPLRDWHARAGYLDIGLVAVGCGGVWAAGALAVRAGRRDWQYAAGLAAAAAGGYLVSRGVGWPGASAAVGRWTSPDGLAALAADLLVLAVCAAALRRRWPRTGPVPGQPAAVPERPSAGSRDGATGRAR